MASRQHLRALPAWTATVGPSLNEPYGASVD